MKQLVSILPLFVLILFVSCKDKMVCAAYQSTYLLDDKRQADKFSFFNGDSLILEASNTGLKKNIYGIRERDYGFWQRQRLLVVDQKDVYSEEVDSLLNSKNIVPEEMAESGVDSVISLTDTVALDVQEDAWANTKRFHYNVDFVNYMLLVGNDVLKGQSAARDSAAANEGKESSQVSDSTTNESKGFLKKIFKGGKSSKKKKEQIPEKDKNLQKPEED